MKKILSIILIVALIYANCLLVVNANEIEFENYVARFINEYDLSISDDDLFVSDDFILTIKHKYVYVESSDNIINNKFDFNDKMIYKNFDDELINYRNKTMTFYKEINEKVIRDLNIFGYNYSYSFYGPFIQIMFENYNCFELSNIDLDELLCLNYIDTIYTNNGICSPEQSVNINSEQSSCYSYADALLDVGIDEQKYNGNGIRIGIIESGTPLDYFGLDESKCEFWSDEEPDAPQNFTKHSSVVANIIGGEYGISPNSLLYFAALGNEGSLNFCNAVNWLVSYPQNVNVINVSYGNASGVYSAISEFMDYITISAKVLFVSSAGNSGVYVNSYSAGFNVLSVGSVNNNNEVSQFSSYLVKESLVGKTIKPTIMAPGESITDIGSISNEYLELSSSGHSGTSISAPFITGICALLIEEYDYLKVEPWKLFSIIISSGNSINGQTGIYDEFSGYGVIDYKKCRQIAFDNNFISISSSIHNTEELAFYYRAMSIPAGSTIYLNGVMFMPANSVSNASTSTEGVIRQTKYIISLLNENYEVLATSTELNETNHFNFSYTNQSVNSINCIIKVQLIGEFESLSSEYGCISYYGEGIHTHWYRIFPLDEVTASNHTGYCNCGDSQTSKHIIDENYFNPIGNGRFKPCKYCNYAIDTWTQSQPLN